MLMAVGKGAYGKPASNLGPLATLAVKVYVGKSKI